MFLVSKDRSHKSILPLRVVSYSIPNQYYVMSVFLCLAMGTLHDRNAPFLASTQIVLRAIPVQYTGSSGDYLCTVLYTNCPPDA